MTTDGRLRLLVAVWVAVLGGGGYLVLLHRRLATSRQACAEAPLDGRAGRPSANAASPDHSPTRRPLPPPRLTTAPPAGVPGDDGSDDNAPERRLERANRVLAIGRSRAGFREAEEAAALEGASSAAGLSPSERAAVTGYMREFQSTRRQMRAQRDHYTDPAQFTDELHRIVSAKRERNEKIRALIGDERARRFFAAEIEESNRFGATHSAAEFSAGGSNSREGNADGKAPPPR